MGDWLNYIIIIVITVFVVSVITENAVINRLQISEGVVIAGGRCRLLDGYGKTGINSQNYEKDSNYDMIRPMSNDNLTMRERIGNLQRTGDSIVRTSNFNNSNFNNSNFNIDPWEGW